MTDDDLAAAIGELAETLGELRRELEPRPRGPRLRPPTPGELLALTDEVAIPALIAILEANVRALEAFQRGLRLLRREREVRDRTGDLPADTRERAADLRNTTLRRLDDALAELQRAASEGTLPEEGPARDLIADARELRDEVDRRLADAAESTDSDRTDAVGRSIPIEDREGTSDDEDRSDAAVDVDAELDTLRDRYGPDTPAEDDGTAGRESDDGTGRGDRDDDGDDGDDGESRPDGS